MRPIATPAPEAAALLDPEALRARLAGDLHLPGEAGWDAARAAWNLAVDQRPAAVLLPESADDVAVGVRAAADAGLRVCVQGTGHNASAYGPLGDSLLIKTERMREVTVDPETASARVGAGVIWGELVGAAAAHGLAALAGSSHDVGVVGFTLGGGVSWLSRKHGLASERVTAIELVDAEGEQLRVTADSDPELFWALRGGGGNFGVVTAMEFGLLQVGEIYAGALFFPLERAGEVLEAWRRWSVTAPEEVSSSGRMLRFPPLPELPEPLRGQSFALVEAAFLGSEERGAELMAPLRELGPIMDTFAMQAPENLLGLHMDPPGPVPGLGDHQMLADLDADSLAALVAAVGPGTDSPILSFEFRHIGGALARREEGSGALGALEGRYMTFGVGMLPAPELEAPLRAALGRAREALDIVDCGRNYANFAEQAVPAESIHGPRTLARMRAVRASVDPTARLHGNHPID
jgi:FAD/FMN-containing dehydrogenase